MCAIVGSFDTKKLRDLVVLNSYRGQHSHSISYYNIETKLMTVTQNLGELPLDDINIPEGHYGICHIQAPTTEAKDSSSIHPATLFDGTAIHALWHNGIVKDSSVQKLKEELHTPQTTWDTELILRKLATSGSPDNIDGTFSCLWYRPTEMGRGDLILFRNEISPMFIDSDMNISSTKFENSTSTKANYMLKMDMVERTLQPVGVFKTVENPYFFWD